MLDQVMSAVLALMEEHYGLWSVVEGSSPVALFGFQYEVGVEPVRVNVETMIATFRQGLSDLGTLWSRMLTPDTFAGIHRSAGSPIRDFHVPDDLWARLIYDVAVACHQHVMPREHLLKALTPLYLGRTASFVIETQGLTSPEAEHRVEGLCQAFEKEKPYLLGRWTGGGIGRRMS